MDFGVVSGSTRRGAATRLLQQDFTPLSPGESVETRYAMCAALALAHAGTEEMFGSAAAEAFLIEMRQGGGAAMVEQYRRLGWSRDLCDTLRRTNDATPESSRSARLAAILLDSLQ